MDKLLKRKGLARWVLWEYIDINSRRDTESTRHRQGGGSNLIRIRPESKLRITYYGRRQQLTGRLHEGYSAHSSKEKQGRRERRERKQKHGQRSTGWLLRTSICLSVADVNESVTSAITRDNGRCVGCVVPGAAC